ncbi:hypothetical protein BJ508DRAFT_135651 [Ascobolus immersus RN42]|uniref:Uncharacterized protein n=1 Tax=Ascobolus immersus RN42 TaxID=1160509 RepID=A0A3N4IK97_ASCIM|nr:hypothetical protein BJ508DRAFT_135651 [Ascobolus immersus RN42]
MPPNFLNLPLEIHIAICDALTTAEYYFEVDRTNRTFTRRKTFTRSTVRLLYALYAPTLSEGLRADRTPQSPPFRRQIVFNCYLHEFCTFLVAYFSNTRVLNIPFDKTINELVVTPFDLSPRDESLEVELWRCFYEIWDGAVPPRDSRGNILAGWTPENSRTPIHANDNVGPILEGLLAIRRRKRVLRFLLGRSMAREAKEGMDAWPTILQRSGIRRWAIAALPKFPAEAVNHLLVGSVSEADVKKEVERVVSWATHSKGYNVTLNPNR